MPDDNLDIHARINKLDTSLFDPVFSQTTGGDRRSLLALQSALAGIKKKYVYLEIGSYLGGSLQPHAFDPRCEKIFSIDTWPAMQKDERWPAGYKTPESSQAKMLDNLKSIGADTAKIICFDRDASGIPKEKITVSPDICFIDGEHTAAKVLSDFDFCRQVIVPAGLIIFHDANVVFKAIVKILNRLKKDGVKFDAYFLLGTVFVVSFNPALDHDPLVLSLRAQMRYEAMRRWIVWSVYPGIVLRCRISSALRKLLGLSDHRCLKT